MHGNEIILSSNMYNMLIERHGRDNVESGLYWDGIKCFIREDKSLIGNQISASGDMALVVMKLTLLTLNKGK